MHKQSEHLVRQLVMEFHAKVLWQTGVPLIPSVSHIRTDCHGDEFKILFTSFGNVVYAVNVFIPVDDVFKACWWEKMDET